MRKLSLFLLLLVSAFVMAGPNDLLWDYTVAAPIANPDNGLYYGNPVSDAAGTNLGLKGIKMNSSGYAYFEKAPVAGKLKLIISNRKNTMDYKVDVYRGSLVSGTPTKGDLIATSDAAQGPTEVVIELDSTVTGVYICRNTPSEGVLSKVEFKETVARTFTDFEIDLRVNPFTLPEGVTQVSYPQNGAQYHGDQHGWCWAAFRFAVDGPVRITLGGCQYAATNSAYVCGTQDINQDGLVNESDVYGYIDITSAGCYHNGGTASWVYNHEEADTLTVYCGQYCPYLKAEACEFIPDVKIKYYDQNGVKLGEETVEPGSAFEPKYTIDSVADGMAFRGWVTSMGKKVNAGDVVESDLVLNALVTPIEYATTGSHYKYDLTKNTFYVEDHELISATGVWHDGQHGFVFNNGEEMRLVVSPKAYVSVGLCTYTNTSNQVIRNAAGDSVAVMQVIHDGEENATTDGALCSFYYESAQEDTLVFNFTTTSYIHFVEVYNVANPLTKVGHVYDIPAGDAAAFMLAAAQLQKGDTIQLHDGIYDLGETVLTTISADSVVIRGESMTGTIIKNAPDAKIEGISTTATILNTGNYNVYENLTLQNALDYYKADNGRAVCLQDKGTYTACYNVRLLSYQDTYYSNKPGQKCWFEDCEIHGTVDFICGSGSVYFYNTLLYCERRSKDGSGEDCLTANNSQTAVGDKGYVFDRCTIQSECPTISLSRSWNDQPQVAYLLTTLDMSAGQFGLTSEKIQRWTIAGMNNCVPYDFSEYNTMDTEGNVISPASNEVAFFDKEENKKETIIGYEAAEQKSYIHFFGDWQPARNYVAFPAPKEESAVENTEVAEGVKKSMVNGQLVIEKNGVRYNALGQVIR